MAAVDFLTAVIICTGVGNTTPVTSVELEFRDPKLKYSTIRYEFSEGSLEGTAYIQSVGRIGRVHRDGKYLFGSSKNSANSLTLSFEAAGSKITNSRLTYPGANMLEAPVSCEVDE